MPDHISKAFEQDLAALKRKIAEMGGIAEEQLSGSLLALTSHDLDLAQKVVRNDARLDALEREIEELGVLTIAQRQPMASDLREVMTALRVASDIERIGDLAKNIGKRATATSELAPRNLLAGLNRMGEKAQQQLSDVLDAYARKDEAKSLVVWKADEDLDSLFTSIFRELLTYMMENPRNITHCTHLLFAAKNLERIGDHSTNIAENIYYLVHGRVLTDERPKKDTTALMSEGNG